METARFKTNLNCQSCVAKVTPFLNSDSGIASWQVDTTSPDKVLTVNAERVDRKLVRELVARSGFKVLSELATESALPQTAAVAEPSLKTYYPLLLIFSYLVGSIALYHYLQGEFNAKDIMHEFMGGFFLIFSFFKLLNLKGFADAYSTYDIIARRARAYGYVYPFLELALGVAYLTRFYPTATNVVTLALMSVSSLGVIQALRRKTAIQCACLGTVFKLPMTVITFLEDGVMAAMSALMLL